MKLLPVPRHLYVIGNLYRISTRSSYGMSNVYLYEKQFVFIKKIPNNEIIMLVNCNSMGDERYAYNKILILYKRGLYYVYAFDIELDVC